MYRVTVVLNIVFCMQINKLSNTVFDIASSTRFYHYLPGIVV